MKRARLFLFVVSTLISILLVEVGYRVFLWRQRVAQAQATTKPELEPTFGFYAYPAPWRFDEKLGFVYNEGPWLSGNIVKGAFNGCGVGGPGNKYGNAFAVRSDYDHAAVKVLLLGSSFTMVVAKEGKLISDLLEMRLSERLGKPVSILNFSRDATGLLTSFDIARTKIPELKPDLLLFVFNTGALSYPRHWRVVHPDPHSRGMWRMAFSLDPNDRLSDRRRIVLQLQVISEEVTQEWCDLLTQAMRAGDQKALRDDPLVRKLSATHQRLRHDLEVPPLAINFYAGNVSFAYNKLIHRNPYHRMQLYEEKTIYAPLAIDDFEVDKQFVEAVEFVKQSGIPFILIHIPTLSEMEEISPNSDFDFGSIGERGLSLVSSTERLTGKQVIHLYSHYDQVVKQDPVTLVQSRQDNHPSPKGVEAMAKAMERLLMETVFATGKVMTSRQVGYRDSCKDHACILVTLRLCATAFGSLICGY